MRKVRRTWERDGSCRGGGRRGRSGYGKGRRRKNVCRRGRRRRDRRSRSSHRRDCAEETAAEEAAIEEAVTEETGSEETAAEEAAAEETAPEESASEGSASEKENPQGLTSGVRQLVPREAAAAAEALFPEEPARGTTAGEAPSAAGETEQDPAEEPQQEIGGEETARENPDLAISSPSAVLMEVSTGTILYEKDAHEARSPASITKIMTLLLIFQELEAGNITLDEMVTTSAHAKSMGGSQVYLEEGEQQT